MIRATTAPQRILPNSLAGSIFPAKQSLTWGQVRASKPWRPLELVHRGLWRSMLIPMLLLRRPPMLGQTDLSIAYFPKLPIFFWRSLQGLSSMSSLQTHLSVTEGLGMSLIEPGVLGRNTKISHLCLIKYARDWPPMGSCI